MSTYKNPGKTSEIYKKKYIDYKTKYLLAKKQLQQGGTVAETYGVLKNGVFEFNESILAITKDIVSKLDSNITEFIFPAGLKTISHGAFRHRSIKEVKFPPTLETIGDEAFFNCKDATFDFSNATQLQSIGSRAFYSCKETTFDFSNATQLKSIGEGAFRNCRAIKEVKFPPMLETIGYGAFKSCIEATFDFSNATQLKSIGEEAFQNCRAIEEVKFPPMLETIGYGAFKGCIEATFDFSNATQLKSIGVEAFQNCIAIKEVKFPPTLETIGDIAFYNCTDATFDFSNATQLKSIGNGVFRNCRAIKEVKFPSTLETIGHMAFSGCIETTFDFSNATQLKSIDEGAFQNCRAIKEVKFPSTLETIGDIAFSGCIETTFDFSNATQLKSIGNGAFQDCRAIKEVKFPSTLETIGDIAFGGCKEATFDFSNATQLKSIGEGAFQDCRAIKEVKFPSTLETIGDGAFFGCKEATFDFSNATNLKSIDKGAFQNCRAIKEVKFPSTLETIGDGAFADCKEATFDFSNATNLKSIGDYAFNGCTAITKVESPPRLETIGEFAFYGCTKIRNIVIDSTSLVSVGTAIFENCTNLQNVEFRNTGKLKQLRKIKFSTDESFLNDKTITGITIDMSPDIMSIKFKNNTSSHHHEPTTIPFSNENNTIDSIITLLNFENQKRDTFFSYFNTLIIKRTQEAYHTDTINDGGFTKEFYQKIITSFFKTCNENVSPFTHCYDTENSIYDVFWINNAFVDKYTKPNTNLDIETVYFFFGVMYGVILNHGEYDMKFNIFNAALILCEYMLHDNELNKRQYRFQTIMSDLICLQSQEYDGCNYNFTTFDPMVVEHLKNTKSYDKDAHESAMRYTTDAAGNDTYISSLIDASFNLYYKKIEQCILGNNLSDTPKKETGLNTVQQDFIKNYLFDNLDNIDLSTVAESSTAVPAKSSTAVSAKPSTAVPAKPSTTIPNYMNMKKESTKIIIRNIKLMKLFSQGVVQTRHGETFQEFFDNIGDGNIYQYDTFIDNLKRFSDFPVIQNLIDYITTNKDDPTEKFKENILNFYEFYSNKRIYTPLRHVSESHIAERVRERQSIEITEMVMESHTCSNTIDIHNKNATAETVFTMLANSKDIEKNGIIQ